MLFERIATRRGFWRRPLIMLAACGIAALAATAWAQPESASPAGTPAVAPVPANQPPIVPGAEPSGSGLSIQMQFLIVIALFVGSIVLGNFLSKRLRLAEQGLKFSIIVFSIAASLVVTILGWPPSLGIDLSGGVILVYGVDPTQEEAGQKPDMDKLVGAITRRVNPGGIKEVTVRPYGQSEVEIIIPKATQDQLDRIKDIIATSGALEFRIVANRRDHSDVIARAEGSTSNRVMEEGQQVARWVPVAPDELPSVQGNAQFATRVGAKDRVEALMMTNTEPVTGQYLRNAAASYDQTGRPCVTFSFDAKGSQLFGELTAANLPDQAQGFKRQLGIILDGELITAPSINGVIYDRGEITGNFSVEDTTRLAAVLTAGQLPAVLYREPSSSLLTGPTLGRDTIVKGVYSMLVSTVVVVIFMVIYYRFAGIVANLAVVLNVLLTIAFMILFHAAFTLSGLAGLALTVGMAVDANVLIYERMREELARGATLRMAIRNGFDRATTTIIDANVTTLISAVVLYAIGTDQVKGFAVTLILGIVMNLFTAITVSRAIFDIAERNRFLTTLRMMKMLSSTNYDFIGKRRLAIGLSVVVIAIGLVGVVIRGKALLDIDFTGGVSVETLFDRQHVQDVAEVRRKVEGLPDVTVQDVNISGEPSGIRFLIVTSEPDEKEVESRLKNIFKGELAYNDMQVKQLGSIEAAPVKPAAPEKPGEKPAEKKGAQSGIGDDENLLALADTPAPDKPDDAADEKKPESAKPQPEKPATKASAPPAADQPADESAKPAAKASDAAKPAATPAAKSETKPAEAAAPAAALTNPFAGGTHAELAFSEPIGREALERLLSSELQKNPQTAETAFDVTTAAAAAGEKAQQTWDLQIALPETRARGILESVRHSLADDPFFPSSNKIGATVAGNTQQQAIYALLASILLIAAYVWFRFTQLMFGFAAILALVHDVLVTLGALALSYWLAPYLGFLGVEPFKINLPIVAAFLTIIGYSLNDTIVIFDRIREIRGKSTELTGELVNASINQTLSRTLLTSLTVFLVVVILYAIGGQGIHGFAFALVIGVISGTYSTVYIATPVLIWLNRSGQTPTGRVRSVPATTPSRSA